MAGHAVFADKGFDGLFKLLVDSGGGAGVAASAMEAAVRERERRRVRNFMTKRLWPQSGGAKRVINMIPIRRQECSFLQWE